MYTLTDGSITVPVYENSAGNAIIGATVTGVLRDSNGSTVAVGGFSWSGLAFLDNQDGTYTYNYAAANVPPHGSYSLVVTVVYGGHTVTGVHPVTVSDYSI